MAVVTHHPPGTPCWTDLQTTDPEGARAFYAGLLGWDYDISGPEMGHYAMARKGQHHTAGIGGMPPGAGYPPSWTLYLKVEDADAALAAVEAAGGKAMMPPMEIPGNGRMAVFVDPGGAVCGLWQEKGFGGAALTDEPGGLAWCEVNSRNAKANADFYATTFGLEAAPMGEGGVEYYTLSKDGHFRAGSLQMDEKWEGIPAHWMVYFAVPDTDAACARAAELGGKVHVPPFDTPYGRIAVLSDPAGAVFSVMCPSELALRS